MIGGLEIADSALRFVVWDGETFKMTGLRLPPDVVVGGQIKDKTQFIEALKLLHDQILGPKKRSTKINVVVSLSSIGIYTQVFTLPFIEGESLEKAVQLNIQMISPLDFSEAYSGWQFANKEADKVRLEILSAFANRGIIDEFTSALQKGGYLTVAVESRALSIARLLKEAGSGFEKEGSYVVMSVDGSGLDFLVIRHGQLHFDYFTSWRDVQAGSKEISPEIFRSAVTRSLHQVLNFYNSHWQEPLAEIVLITTGFREEVAKLVQENFSLAVRDFTISTAQTVAPDWFVALGSAVRGLIPRRIDKEISLLGIDAQEEFSQEQVMGFLRFWRVLMPVASLIFIVAFLSVNFSLDKINKDLLAQVSSVSSGAQAGEMKNLENQISNFNKGVGYLGYIENGTTLKTPLLQELQKYSDENGITLTRVYYQAVGTPISVNGTSKDPDALLAFKKDVEGDSLFANVSLPPANVNVSTQGVEFSMTFSEGKTNSR